MYKGQSAIEFLTTYGMVFLIIAVVLTVLITLSIIPKSTVPAQCYFYGGFNCQDVAYYNITQSSSLPGNSMFTIVATDSVPGIINVSGFNAVIEYKGSVQGECYPEILTQGDQLHCNANFNIYPSSGALYTGTFSLYGDYCTPLPSTQTDISCNSISGNFVFSGSFNTEATVETPSDALPLEYVPITLSNYQSSSVPADFQQMITFNALQYGAYVGNDLGNIRFYQGGSELYSWCESSCSNTAANAIFWVKLNQQINANSNAILQAVFYGANTQYDGKYAGEAPQLSPAYAEYDNGGNVFLWYMGTYPLNNYIIYPASGGDIEYNTVTVTPYGTVANTVSLVNNQYYSTTAWIPQQINAYGIVIEGWVSMDGTVQYGPFEFRGDNTISQNGYILGSTNDCRAAVYVDLSGHWTNIACSGYGNSPWLWSTSIVYGNTLYTSDSSEPPYMQGASIYQYVSITNSLYGINNEYIGIVNKGGNGAGATNFNLFYQVRARYYPPNGVMPSVAYGSASPI